MAMLRGPDDKMMDQTPGQIVGPRGFQSQKKGIPPVVPGGLAIIKPSPDGSMDPTPGDESPGGIPGTGEGPRERQPDSQPRTPGPVPSEPAAQGGPFSPQPRTVSPPSPEAQMGFEMPQMTPPVPGVPTPMAGAGSRAFQPPAPQDLVGQGSNMFGSAGGLLGGGLGVQGSGQQGANDPSQLLALIASLMNG